MTRLEVPVVGDAAPSTQLDATPGAKSGAVVVAMAQIAPRLGDVASNLAEHLELIDTARRGGATLIVFPELSMTGYFLKDLVPDVAVREDGAELAALADACQEIDAVVGCVIETDDSRFFNSAVHLARGRIQHIHHKVYLPTYGLFDEGRYFAHGDRFRSYTAPLGSVRRRHWRAGLLICEDMWHPSGAGILARQGVDVLICPSSSPGRGVGRGAALGTARSYDSITRSYAQLFTSYVIHVNRVGYEDGVGFWGGSRIIGPDGIPLDDAAPRQQALIMQRLDRGALRRARIANPLLRDERHDVNDSEHEQIRLTRANGATSS